jgi:pimeloyl-ACP methyl ester carboxylesterase
MSPTLITRSRARRFSVAGALALFAALALAPIAAPAQSTKPTIVLVHGAWADATSWNPVITQLQSAGFTVFAPPNMLRGLASDAASVANFVKSVPGPVVLVGHSYGGAVASVASATDPNVKALVYVDAFVPDAGDSCLSLLAGGPPPPPDLFLPVPFATATGGDADLFFNPKYYGAVFASDLPKAMSALMAVTQRPLTNSALTDKAPAAEGWKTIPSWYVVGDADMVIPPKAQLFMATRAKAHVSHAAGGGHPSMLSHPEATVAAIMAAVTATSK